MPIPELTLGGVPLVVHAGAPELSAEGLAGASVVRMSDGAAVKITHWAGKASGTIRGDGWMPPGLDGLDYSGPLELLSAQPENITTPATSVVLSSTPRPDAAPWALALLGREWVRAECVFLAGMVTVVPMPAATLYSIYWYPVYQVFATKPSKGLSNGSTPYSWSIPWEEI